MAEVFNVHQQWFDTFGGLLVGGRVYYGFPDTDPTKIVNQIPIFSDRALTISLPNPQTIGADGRVDNKPWLGQRYSIQVNTDATLPGVVSYSSPDQGENPATGTVLALSNVLGIDNITAQTPNGITEYVDQQVFTMRTVGANTDNVTVNIDAVGERALKFNFNEEISPGFFQSGQSITFIYNSQQDNFNWIDSGRGISLLTNVAGDGNDITADGGPSIIGYVDGQIYQFKPNITNAGNVTLKIGTLPVLSIKSQGNELVPDQLVAFKTVEVIFNSTPNPDEFELVSGGGNAVSPSSAVEGNVAKFGSVATQLIDSLVSSLGPIAFTVFTSSLTWTRNTQTKSALIFCIGGGGGGAGTINASIGASGGGGAGGLSVKFSTSFSGPSDAVVVGAAGDAGVAASGGDGGSTSVGSLCMANGGSGAPLVAGPNSGSGATLTGAVGDLKSRGGDGDIGPIPSDSGGGGGGSSFLGGGGHGGNKDDNGVPGKALGSGGGGAGEKAGDANGGAGALGLVYIIEFG